MDEREGSTTESTPSRRRGERIAPQDATMYWLSRRTRNDLFLLYAFADTGVPTGELRARVVARAARIPDLGIRLRPVPRDLDYPRWTPCDFHPDQFLEHALPQRNWAALLDALGGLLDTGVRAETRPWRLHVFRGIVGAPDPFGGSESAVTVAVLQVSHALADGQRAAAIARALFAPGDAEIPAAMEGTSVPANSARTPRPWRTAVDGTRGAERLRLAAGAAGRSPLLDRGRSTLDAMVGLSRLPVQMVSTVTRGIAAYRAQRELAEATAAGLVPEPGPAFEPTLVNRPPVGGPESADVSGATTGDRESFGGPGPVDIEAVGVSGAVAVGPAGVSGTARKLPRAGVSEPVGVSGTAGVSGHAVRLLVLDANRLRVPGRTLTVLVLTAVSLALDEYLTARGEPVPRLGAQVPVAVRAGGRVRNHYRSVGVDLHIEESTLARRAELIAADLADRRARIRHPLLDAQDRVTTVTPAAVLRRDVAGYPLDTPPRIAGHTVVSSVDRGPADLDFGGHSLFTAGFPAIGPVMRLTHGLHGLGETRTLSIHADPAVLPDLDAYTALLRTALVRVGDLAPAENGERPAAPPGT
ncbi:hypothetical protein ACTD5D_00935 [Nocardia takedensis]|uniref:hypothetical protein n=1 Tax=Nocardia takedensis TaxID=259390 RepID=UPI0003064502|nr:hypothetical protein [Nocardia takedensis]